MMEIYNYVKYIIAPKSGNNKVLVGKDGWLFYKLDGELSNYQNAVLYTEDELLSISQYLKKIDEYLKAKNIEFYYFISPDKHRIYDEYYRTIRKMRPDSESKTNQLIDYLRKNTNVRVIYPYETLNKGKKKGILYWKQDTHWNALGAYVGYLELMKTINLSNDYQKYSPEFVSINKIPGDMKEYPNLRSDDLLRMYSYVEKDDYDYEAIVSALTAKCSGDDIRVKMKTVCTNNNKHGNILVYRDSFMTRMAPYLNETFKTVTYYWKYSISKEEIEKVHPDIVILEQVERFVPQLEKLYLKD